MWLPHPAFFNVILVLVIAIIFLTRSFPGLWAFPNLPYSMLASRTVVHDFGKILCALLDTAMDATTAADATATAICYK